MGPLEINKTHGHRAKFIAWMSFLCVFFAFSGALIMWAMQKLLENDKANKLYDYCLTLTLGYLWFRLCIHNVTFNLLLQSSPIFRGMPEGLQRDCAFMAVEGPSIFFWAPPTAYLVGIILKEADIDTVLQRIGPYIYFGSAIYTCDRFMHIFNCFRFDRFFHHAFTLLWMVAVNEWVPRNAVDFSYLCLSLSMEIMEGKVKYFWFFVVRLSRRHARSGPWGAFDSSCDAIDSLLIPKSPDQMTVYSRLFLGYFVTFEFFAPVALLGVYFQLYRDQALLFWKIFSPLMYLVFVALDLPGIKEVMRNAQKATWMELAKGNDARKHLLLAKGDSDRSELEPTYNQSDWQFYADGIHEVDEEAVEVDQEDDNETPSQAR